MGMHTHRQVSTLHAIAPCSYTPTRLHVLHERCHGTSKLSLHKMTVHAGVAEHKGIGPQQPQAKNPVPPAPQTGVGGDAQPVHAVPAGALLPGAMRQVRVRDEPTAWPIPLLPFIPFPLYQSFPPLQSIVWPINLQRACHWRASPTHNVAFVVNSASLIKDHFTMHSPKRGYRFERKEAGLQIYLHFSEHCCRH